MENNNWSRTLLGVYRYLPRVTYALDKIVKTRAYNSSYMSLNNIAFNNVMNVANTILDLTERKVTLINLKLIIEKALRSMDAKSARILILKFIDGKKSAEIADSFKICLRTFFRKVNSALDSFTKALSRIGYTEDKLQEMLKNEKWIIETYNKYSKNVFNTENFADSYELHSQIKNNIIMEFKKVSTF